MRMLRILIAACLVLGGAGSGIAQSFPSRPVRVIMPFPAGGPSDVMMRAIAQVLAERWKQPVLVENRPGANTLIGAEAAAKLPPDGHGLFYATAAALSISPALYRRMPVDPERDFVAVTQLVSATNALMVSSALPVKTLAEFIAYAKAHPGKIDYGSFGIGSTPHLDVVALERAAGITLNHIPFKGAAQVVPELMQGRIGVFVSSVGTLVMPGVSDGRIRLLAASGATRSAQLPEVPTFVEQGVDLRISTWLGLVAPAGTPAELLDRISADVAVIVRDPAFEEKHIKSQGLAAVGSSPAEFGTLLRQNRAYWREVIQSSGIKLDL